ncbi:hypothetical protein O6H91_21G052900 [Diphasiastrum complanatum]|uniref:Uncharacterized protein n=1 Tax=Diphasiastrum complanatum TaxID=34168 RepID=A0ACC2AKJ1_DIPCM|nr:hypothetical protein O6H91_21G052900 [Diphasiastrum complanatum]
MYEISNFLIVESTHSMSTSFKSMTIYLYVNFLCLSIKFATLIHKVLSLSFQSTHPNHSYIVRALCNKKLRYIQKMLVIRLFMIVFRNIRHVVCDMSGLRQHMGPLSLDSLNPFIILLLARNHLLKKLNNAYHLDLPKAINVHQSTRWCLKKQRNQ